MAVFSYSGGFPAEAGTVVLDIAYDLDSVQVIQSLCQLRHTA
jgi:hypothetical protein